jgi:hypothetical protein
MKRALLLVALVACSSKSPTTEAPPPLMPTPAEGSGSAATPPSTDPLADKNPGMGETCGANDACAKGYECVKYYGIAGARGPEFKSCEIRCEMQNKESVCPKGTQCTTIADGPGQVCR